MSYGKLLQNVKLNRQSLMIIGVAVAIFGAFNLKQGARPSENIQEKKFPLTVGFFKQHETSSEDYFKSLFKKLQESLHTYYNVVPEYYTSIQSLCEDDFGHQRSQRIDS